MADYELKYYTHSHKGKKYNNEDAVVAEHFGGGTYFFALADGVGDTDGGEVASSVALYMMEKKLRHLIGQNHLNPSNMKQTLSSLFYAAQEAIRHFVEEHTDMPAMGTTITAMLVHDNKIVWGNAGDSRLYKINDKTVTRLTRDHTIIEDVLFPDDKKQFHLPRQTSNELTRRIDCNNCNPDLYPVNSDFEVVQENVVWLICSDGLIVDRRKDYMELFSKIHIKPDNLHCTSAGLIKNALKNGATGNISIVAITVANPPTKIS